MKTIRSRSSLTFLAMFLTLVAATMATADPPRDGAVNVSGDLTLRGDHYYFTGDRAGSPFPYTGTHRYADYDFEFYRKASDFENWNLRLGGVVNDSKYRSQDWGTELERFRFTWEKGDGGTPFRFEAGEIYGNFTNRTLQRGLRGFLLDIQPLMNRKTKRSFQLLWGLARNDWKDPFALRDQTMGVSFVEEQGDDLRFSLNWVANRRDSTTYNPGLSQHTWSVAFEKPLDRMRRNVFEAEYAWFSGDHEGTGIAGSGLDKRDTGAFMQLRGNSIPFGYTWRFEEYGKDFRPNGANITQNRRAMEGYLSWQIERIRTLSVRLQRFRNSWESPNPMDSDIGGITLSGQVFTHDKLFANLNAYVDRSDDLLGNVDTRSRNLDLNFSRPIRPTLNGRLGFGYRDFDNQFGPNGDNRALQAVLGLDKSIDLGGSPLTIGLNLIRQSIDSSGIWSRDWNTGLSIYHTTGNQEFGLTWNTQALDYRPITSSDVFANDLGFRWQRRSGPTTYGIELARNRRDATKAYHYGFFLSTEFDQALSHGPRKEVAAPQIPAPTAALFDIATVQPGCQVASLLESLKQSGIRMIRIGNQYNSEFPYFEDLFQRQSVVVDTDGEGTVVRVGVLVKLEDFAATSEIMDAFDRVRRRLLERLGNPTDSYERGAVGADLPDEIRSGMFVRVLDWKTPGGVLRLGFPRRLDGRIRLEVQKAASFPEEREGRWGFDNAN